MNENDRLLTVQEVSDLCTVSVRKIWRDVAAGMFPKPLKLGRKTTRWWRSVILQFLQQRSEALNA